MAYALFFEHCVREVVADVLLAGGNVSLVGLRW